MASHDDPDLTANTDPRRTGPRPSAGEDGPEEAVDGLTVAAATAEEIPSHPTLTGDVLDVAHDALDRAFRVLGPVVDGLSAVDDGTLPDERPAVLGLLARVWDTSTTRTRDLAAASEHRDRLTTLVDLLNAVHAAEEFIATGGDEAGRSRVSRVRERLQSVEAADSLAEMIDHVPIATAGLGFDRVLLSRVEDSVWLPERLYFRGDSQWAKEILQAMSESPVSLNSSVLETQMVRQAVPLRVVAPATRPLMNRLMIQLSHTPGYIAAPITDAGRVVGFLHADCYYQGRIPSQADVDTLWLFAQALGPVLARQGLTEQLAGLRRDSAATVPVLGPRGARAPTVREEPSPPPPPRGGPELRGGVSLQELVTPREVDVLRLMSEGASNEQIARRLVISIGTVKSHVKRILRKLDVANRAEAASLWLRSEFDGRSSGDEGG